MTCGPDVRAFGIAHGVSHTGDKMKTLSVSVLLTRKPEKREQPLALRIQYFKNSSEVGTRQPC